MDLVRGGIYLANLNPSKGSEIGKIRPVLIIQSDALNSIKHTTVNILPLTTHLKDTLFCAFGYQNVTNLTMIQILSVIIFERLILVKSPQRC